jgi:hypothetical protein
VPSPETDAYVEGAKNLWQYHGRDATTLAREIAIYVGALGAIALVCC